MGTSNINNKKNTNSIPSENVIHMPNLIVQDTPKLSFGEVIQKYRNINDMNQKELAALMDTSRNTITNWETDKSRPDVDTIKDLCNMLGIPLYELFGIEDDSVADDNEIGMLRSYRRLSSVSKKVILKMVESLLMEEISAKRVMLKESFRIFPLHSTPAAAGTGCPFNEIPPTPIFIKKNRYNEKADAIIRVSGKSMEPLYHDNDLVYIEYTSNVENGHDAVCSTADGAVIKRVMNDKLYSLNSNYPFGEKNEDDHVIILGKVIGIVSPSDQASLEDQKDLEDIMWRELRDFYKIND